MLDFKFIVENSEAVLKNCANRGISADVETVVSLYREKQRLLKEIESIRRERNENAAKMKGPLSPEERSLLVDEGKELKKSGALKEEVFNEISQKLHEEAAKIPNMTHKDVPIGAGESANKELKQWGEVRAFSFTPKDHIDIGTSLDIIDFKTAAKVSGSKFYFLKSEAVYLELALIRYALDTIEKYGFTPIITPDIAKEEIAVGIGFNPRGEESNIYTLEGEGSCLVGTAEITLGGYHSDTVIDLSEGPIFMGGFSHCFRREAGAAGQFSKGLYRVHQFSKVEMFAFCKPEESEAIHLKMRDIEEEIFQGLDIPYRVIDIGSGDLGASASRKYDLEAWMPGRGKSGDWGEVTSTSNCTDYQARRLNIRYKEADGNRYVHTLNGTAVAVTRAIMAILENGQNEDGSVTIPQKLTPYTGFSKIERR